MFIDRLLDTLLRPFRELQAKWWSLKSIKGGIEGDVRRVQMLGTSATNQAQYAAQAVKGAPAQMQQGYQAAQQQVQPPKPAGQKMSWWPWSKKTCAGCQNKLDKSWDKCPYCGLPVGGAAPGQQAVPNPQGQGQPQMMGQPGQMGQGQMGMPGPGGQMPYPGQGGANRTIAFDPGELNKPLLGSRDQGENVGWLVPLEGPMTGELLQFRGRAVIGTADGCDFKIMDAAISGRHAEITVDAQNRYRITDLGSTNGTFVNDKKVSTIDLVDGDNLRMGRTTFKFKTKS